MAEHQQAQKSSESKSNTQTRAILPKQIPISHPASIIQRARINPKSLTHADVMQLQRTIGNRAVGKLLTELGLIPSKAKQTQPVQMQKIPEEEEPLHGKFAEPLQCQEIPEEEEPLQGKFESVSTKEICPSCIQMQEILEEEEPLQKKIENNTGMPDNLKAGVESLSRIDMSDVKVHYNSDKPAEVGALAYTQGTNIHVAPGQEKHLPHEAWHVVQQKQGRVQPTKQLKDGIPINDDEGMEQEADEMGEKVFSTELDLIILQDQYQPESHGKHMLIDHKLTSQMQHANRVNQEPHMNFPVQRKPSDYCNFIPDDIKSVSVSIFPSTWRKIETSIDYYSRFKNEDLIGRNTALNKLELLGNKFLRDHPTKRSEIEEERTSFVYYVLFGKVIPRERQEIEKTKGRLSVQPPQLPVHKSDPQPSTPMQDKDKKNIISAILLENTDILNENAEVKGNIQKGKAVKIIQEWDDQKSTVKKDFYQKIEKEDRDKVGDKYFQNIKSGYIMNGTFMYLNLIENRGDLRHTMLQDPLIYPLFPHDPSVEDVKQGYLGDCYLLAAVISIVNNGKEGRDHFMEHMKDCGDGNVLVKLYEEVGQSKVISISKSVVVKGDTEYFAKGALWVKLLEKAYVAAGFSGRTGSVPDELKSYGIIAGGGANVALMHLTGKRATSEEVNKNQMGVGGDFFNSLWARLDRKGYSKGELDKLRSQLEEQFTKKEADEFLYNSEYLKTFNDIQLVMGDIIGALGKVYVNIDSIKEYLIGKKFTEDSLVYKLITEAVMEDKILLSGSLGMRKYTESEIDIYEKIKTKLDAKKELVISTKEKITDDIKDVTGIGYSGGEPMSKGLVGRHAYSIVGYSPDKYKQGETLAIRLRNPWGEYGRVYKELDGDQSETDIKKGNPRKVSPSEKADIAEFWIDIAEVSAYFDKLHFSE